MMDRKKLKELAQAARVRTARADGQTITEIINSTGVDERKVLDILNIQSKPATNNRPPRTTPKARQ